MAKGKEKKGKREKLTRKQRRAMDRSFSGDSENLDEQLKSFGLCTKNITGDGNCLFRSLSDQYYGHDGNHKAIRQEICQYLRDNEDTYKFFVEDDQSFEHHVECMSQDATFGGNMELAAFAKLKKVDIKVYQPGMIYVINGVDENEESQGEEDTEEPQILHIAYHSWEHYSSVRNIDGPYTGPPEIKTIPQAKGSEDKSDAKSDIEAEEEDLNSKEKVVRNACPEVSIRKIRRLLIKYKGNPDKVIDAIYDSENKAKEKEEEGEKEKEEEKEKTSSAEAKEPQPREEEEHSTTAATESATLETEDVNDGKETKADGDEDAVESVESNLPTSETLDKEAVPLQKESETKEKPKKLSAAERKKEQKRRQKENKRIKDMEKAARRAKYKQEKKGSDEGEALATDTTSVTQSMKEMYI